MNNFENEENGTQMPKDLDTDQIISMIQSTIDKENENQTPNQPVNNDIIASNVMDNPNNEDDFAPKDISGKKYVLQIKAENISFFETLTPDQRADLVNKTVAKLKIKKDPSTFKNRAIKTAIHALVIAITTVIALPIIFIAVNKSIEVTLNSYNHMQAVFEKLYQEKGGLKKKNNPQLKKLSH